MLHLYLIVISHWMWGAYSVILKHMLFSETYWKQFILQHVLSSLLVAALDMLFPFSSHPLPSPVIILLTMWTHPVVQPQNSIPFSFPVNLTTDLPLHSPAHVVPLLCLQAFQLMALFLWLSISSFSSSFREIVTCSFFCVQEIFVYFRKFNTVV